METLIELIVWVFRAIFGDSDKSSEPTRSDRPMSPRTPAQRGPYSYGDEARRPKTLEEILEEVRREAAQKRGAPAARPAQPPPQPRPVAQVRVEERKLKSTIEKERERPLSAPLSTSSPDTGRALGRLESAPQLASLPQMSKPVPEPAPHARGTIAELVSPHEAAASLAASAQNPQAISTVREMQAFLTQQPAAISSPALAFVKALRNATPQARREAAWQAVVLGEIFGAPRSRRRGRRLI